MTVFGRPNRPGSRSRPDARKSAWPGARWGVGVVFAVVAGAGAWANEPDDAPEPWRLSVEDAVLLALDHNPALESERQAPVIAGSFELIERAEFDTRVFAETSVGRDQNLRLGSTDDTERLIQDDTLDVSAGFARRLPWGTEVDVTARQSFLDRDLLDSDRHTSRVGVGLTQQLLRGRGAEVNLIDVRRAELDTLRSRYELQGFTETLVAEVEAAYWDVVLADREIEIYEESLRLADAEIARTEERIELGDVAETELAPLRAERALRRQEWLDARSRLQEARLALLQRIAPAEAFDLDQPLELTGAPERRVDEPDPAAFHEALALERRADLNEARLQLRQNQLEVRRTRNGVLPDLELFVSLGRSGFSDSFSGSVQDLDGDSYDAELGLRLEQPLSNRAPRARHTRSLAERNQASASLNNLARLIRQDVRGAHIELERAAAQIEATAATREAQEERVRVEEDRFRAGDSTAFAVAQAQRDLLQSRINEEAARVAYRNARTELYRQDGTLLARRGIDPTAAPVHEEAPMEVPTGDLPSPEWPPEGAPTGGMPE